MTAPTGAPPVPEPVGAPTEWQAPTTAPSPAAPAARRPERPERSRGRIGRFLGRVLPPDRLLLAVLAVLAVVPFERVFGDLMFLVYSAGAVLLVTVVTGLLSPRRSFALVLWACLGALALYLALVLFRDDLGAFVVAFREVWKLLYSDPPRFTNDARFVVGPVFLAATVAYVSLELAARTRLVALTTVPALVAFGLATAYTGQRPVGIPGLPLVMVAVVLAVVLVRGNRVRAGGGGDPDAAAMARAGVSRRGGRAHLRMGVPVIAVVGLAALGIGQMLPVVKDALRTDLNQRHDPDVDVTGEISPLAQVKDGIINPANPVMFTVRFDGVAPERAPDRVRIAALERYDGSVWQTGTKFPKVGVEAPPGPASRPTRNISQSVKLQSAYRTSFLPALDRPREIRSPDSLGFDRISGMLVTDTPRDRVEYQLTSEVPVVDEDLFRNAPLGVDPSVIDLANLPADVPVPAAVTAYANQARFDQPTTYETLKAIEADLKGDTFGYNANATPGHAYASLERFLDAGTDALADGTSRVGYSEQFAASFALVARLRRLPSRVVVGYLIKEPAAAVGRDLEMRASDMHAWAEVHLNGVGWVAFDGTNRQERPPEPPPPQEDAPAPTGPTTTQPVPVPTTALTTEPDVCEIDPAACTDEGTSGGWTRWLLVLLLLVLLTPVVIVVLKRLRRRRRRRVGTTAQRIVGAWREVLDRLLVAGVPTRSSMTANELSGALTDEAAGRGDTASRVAEMGPLLDQALYSPDAPPEELVDAAWKAERGVADVVREQRGLGARLKAAVDPRPLVGSRR